MGKLDGVKKGGKKVLAVDDEQEILKLYDTFLKFKGYTVKTVSNAADCIKEMQKEHPDIVLLDINMPTINGLQLLEMIRSDASGKNLPIIVISARGDEKTIAKAVSLGCDNFMVKPFKMKDLATRILAELFTVDMDFVRSRLSRQGFPQNNLLRSPGLRDHGSALYDAYPFKEDEMEFCFLVPRGQRAAPLSKKDDDELKDSATLYYKHPMKWKRLWPKP